MRGRACQLGQGTLVGTWRCCLDVKLAKYETWCFPSILVNLCNIVKLNDIYYIGADSLFREFPLPLYCAIVFSCRIADDNECVWVFINIKET